MNARGSHVGVMLSFVIFITFIVFLLVVFSSRINLFQDKESFLEPLEEELIARFNSDLAIIQQTKEQYDADYDGLKSDLNIPENVEFAFRFVDEDVEPEIEIIAENEIPEGIDVYTKEVLLLYDEKSKAGYLTIKTW